MAKPRPAKTAGQRTRTDAIPKHETEAERVRSHERFMQRWATGAIIATRMIYTSGVVLTAAVVFYFPVTVAPGEVTAVSLSQNFIANIHAHVWIAWGASAMTALGWHRERRARLKEREEKDRRLRQFEISRDPTVSTSGLNLDGTALRRDGQ